MQKAHKLSILIIDNDLLVRQGLKLVLSSEYRDIAFGEARTAEEAVAEIKAQPWRLVILDIDLPNKDGFFVLQEICTRRPEAVTLVLSLHHPDSLYASSSLQLGAAGYISKSSSRSDLLKAVGSVLEGKKYFSESIRLGVDNPGSTVLHSHLSAQEFRVLLSVAAGGRTGIIAAELNLSCKTVSTYKRRVLNKLGLTTTAELVRYVIDHRLS